MRPAACMTRICTGSTMPKAVAPRPPDRWLRRVRGHEQRQQGRDDGQQRPNDLGSTVQRPIGQCETYADQYQSEGHEAGTGMRDLGQHRRHTGVERRHGTGPQHRQQHFGAGRYLQLAAHVGARSRIALRQRGNGDQALHGHAAKGQMEARLLADPGRPRHTTDRLPKMNSNVVNGAPRMTPKA